MLRPLVLYSTTSTIIDFWDESNEGAADDLGRRIQEGEGEDDGWGSGQFWKEWIRLLVLSSLIDFLIVFIVELKKPSSCSVQLSNNTNYHVAFKVKTTSPKRYCVRPNVGVIMPNSSCDFIVTMQMPRTTPLDLECKDKFLIQSTVVSAETTDEYITASMFAKDGGKLVEEKKLRVILVSPPHSPTLSPINGALNQGMGDDYLFSKDHSLNGVGNLSKQQTVSKDTEESVTVKIKEQKPVVATELKPVKNVEFMLEKDVQELKPAKGIEELKPAKDKEEMEPAKNSEVLNPTMYTEELKPVKYTEELKPVKYTEELKPSKHTEVLKTARYMEELKPVKYTEELKPSKHTEVLKTARYMEELKPTLYAEELKPTMYAEESKSSMYSEELKPLKYTEELSPAKYVEELKPSLYPEELKSAKYVEELKPSKYVEDLNPANDVMDLNSDKYVEELKPAKDIELKSVESVEESKPVKDVELKNVKAVEELKLFKDVEEIKSKLSKFELKLHQADATILQLMEERKSNIEERKFLQEKLVILSTPILFCRVEQKRRKNGPSRVSSSVCFYGCIYQYRSWLPFAPLKNPSPPDGSVKMKPLLSMQLFVCRNIVA
ncbi:hypothetical protein F8388_018101 [Cannabis sativa]|uniref:MSP domain-containing protein n=1 Tax=Cannabis sativa TaxID=3483 RepID=A0A7J6HKQ0_CANSA|nr:hypothetical protein G4B88_018195 [Cannabis sativa]KAF4395827.1 hypothetical protein F8388_018101 [Cannabis sativa]